MVTPPAPSSAWYPEHRVRAFQAAHGLGHHRLTAHVAASFLSSGVIETRLDDDLALIAAGWRARDGKHYRPEHWPTNKVRPIKR